MTTESWTETCVYLECAKDDDFSCQTLTSINWYCPYCKHGPYCHRHVIDHFEDTPKCAEIAGRKVLAKWQKISQEKTLKTEVMT